MHTCRSNAHLIETGLLTRERPYGRTIIPMSIRTKRFDARLSEGDRAQLDELAALLRVDRTEALKRAVAEKLRRVKGKRSGQVAA